MQDVLSLRLAQRLLQLKNLTLQFTDTVRLVGLFHTHHLRLQIVTAVTLQPVPNRGFATNLVMQPSLLDTAESALLQFPDNLLLEAHTVTTNDILMHHLILKNNDNR
jgi:hypothetical protein